ncbi:MAG TPA: hypothetical protein VJO12_07700, partial [Stellaceae bacterium]|nr:hypothetical protein [Stellaceae bacterium]
STCERRVGETVRNDDCASHHSWRKKGGAMADCRPAGFSRRCDFGVDLWCDTDHIVQCGIARRPTTLPYVF